MGERECSRCGENIEDLESGTWLDEAAYSKGLCVFDYKEAHTVCGECDNAAGTFLVDEAHGYYLCAACKKAGGFTDDTA